MGKNSEIKTNVGKKARGVHCQLYLSSQFIGIYPKGHLFLKGLRHSNNFIQSLTKYENLDFDKLNKAKRIQPNLFQIPLKCINIYKKTNTVLGKQVSTPMLHLTDDNIIFGLCFPGNHRSLSAIL